MSMYEIHIEVLKDLLQKPGPDATNLELAYSAQDGAYIKVTIPSFFLFLFDLSFLALGLTRH